MKKNYYIYVWLNDKDTKKQEINTLEASKVAKNLACKLFGGATIYECDGVYTHDNWDIVVEKTLKIELLQCEFSPVVEFVKTLKVAFNQESILVKSQVENCDFM